MVVGESDKILSRLVEGQLGGRHAIVYPAMAREMRKRKLPPGVYGIDTFEADWQRYGKQGV